jgi:hypothetical protein
MPDTSTPIDPVLLKRLSEEDLNFRSRQTIRAIEKAKTEKPKRGKGQDIAELERMLQVLEEEKTRRQSFKKIQ